MYPGFLAINVPAGFVAADTLAGLNSCLDLLPFVTDQLGSSLAYPDVLSDFCVRKTTQIISLRPVLFSRRAWGVCLRGDSLLLLSNSEQNYHDPLAGHPAPIRRNASLHYEGMSTCGRPFQRCNSGNLPYGSFDLAHKFYCLCLESGVY
jgi:hypothetical protein